SLEGVRVAVRPGVAWHPPDPHQRTRDVRTTVRGCGCALRRPENRCLASKYRGDAWQASIGEMLGKQVFRVGEGGAPPWPRAAAAARTDTWGRPPGGARRVGAAPTAFIRADFPNASRTVRPLTVDVDVVDGFDEAVVALEECVELRESAQ